MRVAALVTYIVGAILGGAAAWIEKGAAGGLTVLSLAAVFLAIAFIWMDPVVDQKLKDIEESTTGDV